MKKIFAAIATSAFAFAATSCAAGDEQPSAEETTAESTLEDLGHVVELQADGSEGAEVSVTFVNDEFETTQHSKVDTPWSAEITRLSAPESALGINMTAQVSGDGGSVSCRILWDGEVVSEDDGSGPFAIADCVLPRDLP